VLLALALSTLFLGGYVFAATVGVVFAGCIREWERMVTLRPTSPLGYAIIGVVGISGLFYPAFGLLGVLGAGFVASVLAALGPRAPRLWRVAGVVFFTLVIGALVGVRGSAVWNVSSLTDTGFWAGVFLGTVIVITDSGAYFTGRQVGGEKLAPDISPGKTWSGAIGGFAMGTLAGLVLWLVIVPQSPWWIGLSLAAAISIIGQVGDLCESALKRRFRIKDSGDIIPGHGGLMDRLDSMSFGALFLFAVGALHQGLDAAALGILVW
jgi:phosphatidate cytidylyltransferase